jgi:hypothetical protein
MKGFGKSRTRSAIASAKTILVLDLSSLRGAFIGRTTVAPNSSDNSTSSEAHPSSRKSHTRRIEIEGKQLGLLHELLPQATRFAVLVNPTAGLLAEFRIQQVRSAASTIGRQIDVLNASTSREIDSAFAGLMQKSAEALLEVRYRRIDRTRYSRIEHFST